jgi:hypothetical protein
LDKIGVRIVGLRRSDPTKTLKLRVKALKAVDRGKRSEWREKLEEEKKRMRNFTLKKGKLLREALRQTCDCL